MGGRPNARSSDCPNHEAGLDVEGGGGTGDAGCVEPRAPLGPCPWPPEVPWDSRCAGEGGLCPDLTFRTSPTIGARAAGIARRSERRKAPGAVFSGAAGGACKSGRDASILTDSAAQSHLDGRKPFSRAQACAASLRPPQRPRRDQSRAARAVEGSAGSTPREGGGRNRGKTRLRSFSQLRQTTPQKKRPPRTKVGRDKFGKAKAGTAKYSTRKTKTTLFRRSAVLCVVRFSCRCLCSLPTFPARSLASHLNTFNNC